MDHRRLQQLTAYLLTGGAAALVQIGLLYVLTEVFSIWYLYSSAIAFVAAVVLNFLFQKQFTFRESANRSTRWQFTAFFILAVLNLCISTAVLTLLVEFGGVYYILAQIAIIGALAIFNFMIYRAYIFKETSGT
jgi:putative flippase GtrA